MLNSLYKLFILLLISLSFACQRYVLKPYDNEKLLKAYDAALEDTRDPSKLKIYTDLIAVTPDNHDLVWNKFSGKDYVLAVMWKKAGDLQYYKNDCTSGTYNTAGRYTFVTLVPELKDACRAKFFGAKDGVTLRLEKMLGLKPGSEKEYFIEVWVQPEDLLRPCRDPEITDHNCNLIIGDTTLTSYREYYHWLQTGNAGYPFTQLGYTYDWNKTNRSHEGLSEFIIDKQSQVVIGNITRTDDYCFVRKVKP